jgi:hypothetical protein
MEKEYGTITFLNSIKDTFPFIESTIIVLDNNFNWWKKNYEILEEKLANISSGIADKPIEILTRFTIYNGEDENVKAVKWNGPAIEFTFLETSSEFAIKVKNQLGKSTWEGHKLITEDNKLFILIE